MYPLAVVLVVAPSMFLSICVFVYACFHLLSICLFVCLSIYLSRYLFIYWSKQQILPSLLLMHCPLLLLTLSSMSYPPQPAALTQLVGFRMQSLSLCLLHRTDALTSSFCASVLCTFSMGVVCLSAPCSLPSCATSYWASFPTTEVAQMQLCWPMMACDSWQLGASARFSHPWPKVRNTNKRKPSDCQSYLESSSICTELPNGGRAVALLKRTRTDSMGVVSSSCMLVVVVVVFLFFFFFFRHLDLLFSASWAWVAMAWGRTLLVCYIGAWWLCILRRSWQSRAGRKSEQGGAWWGVFLPWISLFWASLVSTLQMCR